MSILHIGKSIIKGWPAGKIQFFNGHFRWEIQRINMGAFFHRHVRLPVYFHTIYTKCVLVVFLAGYFEGQRIFSLFRLVESITQHMAAKEAPPPLESHVSRKHQKLNLGMVPPLVHSWSGLSLNSIRVETGAHFQHGKPSTGNRCQETVWIDDQWLEGKPHHSTPFCWVRVVKTMPFLPPMTANGPLSHLKKWWFGGWISIDPH